MSFLKYVLGSGVSGGNRGHSRSLALPRPPVRNIALANWFITKAKSESRYLTQMHIQKLLFFAHAWSLVHRKMSLCKGEFVAWKYGPVQIDVFDHTKFAGASPIGSLLAMPTVNDIYQLENPTISGGDLPAIEALEATWALLGAKDHTSLGGLVFEAGSPWHSAFCRKEGTRITDLVISDYYQTWFIR